MEIGISVLQGPANEWNGDALLILAGEGSWGAFASENFVPERYSRYVKILEERGDFKGKKGSIVKVPLFEGAVKNLYLAGLGKEEEAAKNTPDALANALRKIGRERGKSVLIIARPGLDAVTLGETAELAGYVFDKYKKKDEKENGDKFSLKEIFVRELDAEKAALGKIFGASQRFARDIANEPGNVINPVSLAELASDFAKEHGLDCEIWDEKKLAAEGMGALLAVGRGSAVPPRLIHLTYSPKAQEKQADKARKKIVFVGKGITFDSGGLDLKPAEFLKTMKGDKSGACNVLGIMKGVTALEPDAEVHGIIAAAENMPGGNSFRPDDIIKARNGKTIEIDNTDAEGRLVLADALAAASELKPDVIIDMATLTGACAVALGSWSSGLFTADEALCEALLSSARRRGERLWRLPIDDEKIGESLKSKFADLINGGSRYGGATFAAMFLAEFVEKGIPWAHIDIAGADFMKEESGIYSRGASAWGVRTCLDYLASE